MKPDPVHGQATALVLQGGGARGAYQVGALRAISEIMRRRKSPFPIVCGSSVGAINAAPLAVASMHFPRGVRRLERLWRSLHCGSVYETRMAPLLGTALRWLTTLVLGRFGHIGPSSLLDNSPLARLLEREVHPDAISRAIACDALHALCITASSYDHGKAVTFFQANATLKEWSRARRSGERTRITPEHLLASSALPFVFSPVELGGAYYGDGSMRLTSPLSPAIHSGADRILVIAARDHEPEPNSESPHINPSFGEMVGHALDILFNDNLDSDHERLIRINHTLSLLSDEGRQKTPLRQIESLMLSPSRDLRLIASDHATELPLAIRLLMRSIGSWGSDGRLVSYLLFEPGYIGALIDLGYADTMARADEVREFLLAPAGAAVSL
ncbi:patatin-like phospholipase family protein [Pontibaca salina]|uniref:Patatin-like phospholipase family protein n=1 Tax=Pontibaca salina TaxID=2795731 RepID=A0A934HKJ9_9RHOB|nr:patatin-like phospholipase family protein [Pontibaca salina]MBI6628546.1 patatin-like phospholipase family protein [Pontibaca salina]